MVPVTIASEVWVKVFSDQASSDPIAHFRIGPLASPDGKAFVAPAGEAVSFTTADGIVIDVPDRAFEEATVVSVTKLEPETLAIDSPDGLALGAYINVSFGGQANETLRVKVPITAELGFVEDDARVFIGSPIELPWGRRLKVLSIGGVLQEGDERFFSNDPSLQPEPLAESDAKLFGGKAEGEEPPTCQDTKEEGLSDCFIQDACMEFRSADNAAFFYEKDRDWVTASGYTSVLDAQNRVIYEAYEDTWVYKPLAQDWNGAYVLPVRLNEPIRIVERDHATGWIIKEDEYSPIMYDAGLTEISLTGPTIAPMLISASPFELIRFRKPPFDESDNLTISIQAKHELNEKGRKVIKLREADGFKLAIGTHLSVFDVEETFKIEPDEPRVGPTPIFGAQPFAVCEDTEWKEAEFTGSDDMLLVVTSGDLRSENLERFVLEFDQPLDLGKLVDSSGFADSADAVAVLNDLGPDDQCEGASPGYPLEVPMNLEWDKESPVEIKLVPYTRLPAGHRFELKLLAPGIVARDGDPEDGREAPTYPVGAPRTFIFATRPAPGEPVASMNPGQEPVRDLVKVGNLLMVATASGKLLAVDASQTTAGVGAGKYVVHATMEGDQERITALAADGHNRVFYNALHDSTWGVRAVRLEDVRQASEQSFEPVPGAIKIAYALGYESGLTISEWIDAGAIPSGIPVDFEVLSQDEVGSTLKLEEFHNTYVNRDWDPADGDPPYPLDDYDQDGDGYYEVPITLFELKSTYMRAIAEEKEPSTGEVPELEEQDVCPLEPGHNRYQRVTIDNVSTGQTWSFDITNPWLGDSGEGPAEDSRLVRARKTDELRVRYNVITFGYIAIMGGGVTVVDLNRAYRMPLAEFRPGEAQCGRRIGSYQGQSLDFSYCEETVPGFGNPVGIKMTPALAVHGPTGCTDDGECERGSGEINIYNPVISVGLVHSRTSDTSPGAFQPKPPLACMRSIRKVVERHEPPDPPPELPVWLRDIALANDATWVDHGVRFKADIVNDKSRVYGLFQMTSEGKGEVDGDLLFLSLGKAGVFVFDVTGRQTGENTRIFGEFWDYKLIGHLWIDGHEIYRLQVDDLNGLLFAGGFRDDTPIIDVWDIRSINGAPEPFCDKEDVEECVDRIGYQPTPITTIENIPWTTRNLGIDPNGTGLLYTWNDTNGITSIPFHSPRFRFVGLYLPEDTEIPVVAEGEPEPERPQPELKGTSMFIPLGVPMELSTEEEKLNRARNESLGTAAFKVRVSLPGSLGPEVKAVVQSLRMLPEERYLGAENLGQAVAMKGGLGWPDTEVSVTLKRIGLDGDVGESGHLSTAYNLYESEETILLIADPRALKSYERQDIEEGDLAETADEMSQCRRCERPYFIDEPEQPADGEEPVDDDATESIKELLAGGRYVRVFIPTSEVTSQFFADRGDSYRAPVGYAEVSTWADSVPSPIQVSQAEPPLNPAIWSPQEAGVAVSLASGDMLLSTTDHTVRGRSIPFSFDRSYRSGTMGYGPLGSAGWSSALFAHLRVIKTTGEVEYHDGTGKVFRFLPRGKQYICGVSDEKIRLCDPPAPSGYEYDGNNKYLVQKGLYLRLQQLPGAAGWRLIGEHNDVLIFNEDGKLVEVRDRLRHGAREVLTQGNTIRLEYDRYGQMIRVIDDLDRHYTFEYEEDTDSPKYGLLKSFRDFITEKDRTIEYTYDNDRRLMSVVLPDVSNQGEYASYSYQDPTIHYSYTSQVFGDDATVHGELSKLRLEGYRRPGSTVNRATARYDELGRVKAFELPGIDDWSLQLSGETDSESEVETPFPIKEAMVTTPWSKDVEYQISNGRVTIIKREDVEVYSPGQSGYPTTVQTLATTFNYYLEGDWDDGRLKDVTYFDGSKRTYTYRDSEDRLAKAGVKKIVHEKGGASAGGHDYDETEISYEYEADSDNHSVSFTDQKNRVVKHGVPKQTGTAGKDPDPVCSGYEAENVFTTTTYNKYGQPVLVEKGVCDVGIGSTLDRDQRIKYYYGEDSFLDRMTLGSHDFMLYKHDEAGNVTEETAAWGPVATTKYDEWDRPIQRVDGIGGGSYTDVSATSELAYDTAGRLIRRRHKQEGIDGGWVETIYQYNDRDQIEKVIEKAIASDSVGGSLNTGTTTYSYNSSGQLESVESPEKYKTTYFYDPDNRINSIGRSGTNAKRMILYDTMEREVYTTDGEDGVWSGQYDAWGRLFEEMLPSGVKITSKYDEAGMLTDRKAIVEEPGEGDQTVEVTLSESTYKYTSFGALKEETATLSTGAAEDGKSTLSFVTINDYNRSGKLKKVTVGNGGDVSRTQVDIDYDDYEMGRIESVTDAEGNTLHYKYYRSCPWPNQIINEERVNGELEVYVRTEFERDALGRPTANLIEGRRVVERKYDEVGNVLNIASGGAHANRRVMTYDGRGQLLSEKRPDIAGEVEYAYDEDGRIVERRVLRDGYINSESTTFGYDPVGRLNQRTVSSEGISEVFTYNDDDTLDEWETRVTNASGTQLRVKHWYDAGNRMLKRTMENAADFSGSSLPVWLAPVEMSEVFESDSLFRTTSVSRWWNEEVGDTETAVTYEYGDGDLRAVPTAESVGKWATWWPEHSKIDKIIDLFGNTSKAILPKDITVGVKLSEYVLSHDGLDRVTSVTVDEFDLGTYTWGGPSSLHSISTGDGSLQQTYSYRLLSGELDGVDYQGAVVPDSSMLYQWDAGIRLKRGRSVDSEQEKRPSLLFSMGWDWHPDAAHRMWDATSVTGIWVNSYGHADELKSIRSVSGTGAVEDLVFSPGSGGRVDGYAGEEHFSYSSVGQRIEDDRHKYVSTWQGLLTEVMVKDDAEQYAGHRVTYRNDAIGRLLERTHYDKADKFVEKRGFVWQGWSLLAEISLNEDEEILWVKEYLPGPGGLDDSPQIRVHTTGTSQWGNRDVVYSLFRDEVGTVIALTMADYPDERLLARYLYTPYGEAHLEIGPELLKIDFNPDMVMVNDVQQADPVEDETLGGSVQVRTTLPLSEDTYDSLMVEEWYYGTEDWVDAKGYFEIGADPEDESVLLIMPRQGWRRGQQIKITLGPGLKDDFGRPIQLPEGEQDGVEIIVDVPEPLGESLPFDERSFELEFDNIEAIEDSVAGRERKTDIIDDLMPGGQNSLFQGLWFDPVTGLAYARHRWYDPKTASWLSEDSYGNIDSENLYAFVGWQPHMNTDPTGEFIPQLVGGAASVIIGFTATCIFEGCSEYSLVDLGVDFGLGAATVGLSSWGHLRHLTKAKPVAGWAARAGLEAGLDIGGEVLRHELQGQDYTWNQLAIGSVLNLGIGEGGSFVGRKFASSMSRAASIDSMAGRSWDNFRTAYKGEGFSNSGLLSVSNMYGRRNSVLYPIYEGAVRLRQGASRAGRVLRGYLKIEDHHLINQATLTGKNPHELIEAAAEMGVDIRTADWNIKRMFHRGGHTNAYYQAVRDRLDVAAEIYRADLAQGIKWSPQTMESTLREVAAGIRSDIFWLKLRLY
jgi:RHS repeat-associated protein